MIEDDGASRLDAELRAWAQQALATAPQLAPVVPPAAERPRRIWLGLLAAALVVGVVSLTAVAPRLLHRTETVPPANTALSDGLGYYNLADATFHLRRNATGAGPSDFAYKFGPVAPDIQPLTGDWNGDGRDGIGYYNPADGTVHLRNDATRSGPSDYAFILTTVPNAQVIVGDWAGDGRDGIGYWVPGANSDGSTALVYLRDDATRPSRVAYGFALPRLGVGQPALISGDWEGLGHDGLADAEISASTGFAQLYLDNNASDGFGTTYQISLHAPGVSVPFAGDWDGDGRDGIGYFNPADQTVHLRNDATRPGPSNYAYKFATFVRPTGPAIVILAGHW